VHPLGELTKSEFNSAVRQVVALKQNYGTTFTSTEFIYGTTQDQEQQ